METHISDVYVTRMRRGLTQKEAAAAIGISQPTLRAVESGKTGVNRGTSKLIADWVAAGARQKTDAVELEIVKQQDVISVSINGEPFQTFAGEERDQQLFDLLLDVILEDRIKITIQ